MRLLDGVLHEGLAGLAHTPKVQLVCTQVSDAWANDVQLPAGSEVRKLQPKQRTNTRCAWYHVSLLQSKQATLVDYRKLASAQ